MLGRASLSWSKFRDSSYFGRDKKAFLRMDGGCGASCGLHAKEVLEAEAPPAINNVSLLRAYIHAAFKLDYNCGYPTRLPGPVIPGTIADGGYVVCDEPEIDWHRNSCSLFSWGIASDDTFEAQLSQKYGCEVHEFDPTVNGSLGANASSLVHFHKMGAWSHRTQLSIGPVDSISSLVSQYWRRNTSLNLKIDIEGAEWETLPAVPDAIFDQVDHLILEIHTANSPTIMGAFLPPTYSMVETLERVREKFYLFHYHVNNCCSPTAIGPHDFIPGPIELSFIRKALIPGMPTGPFHLHEELNGPNVLFYPQLDDTVMPGYGWNRTYDKNWVAYEANPFAATLDRFRLADESRESQRNAHVAKTLPNA
jgi:hypothetical protein